MRNLIVFIVLIFITNSVFSQKRKDERKLWKSDYNYEVRSLGVGVQGTKLIKVYAYARKFEDARILAKKRAVAACIFKGIPGIPEVKKIMYKPDDSGQYDVFFKDFFETGGQYLQFVSITNDAVGSDKMKVGRGYKVGLTVSVQYDNLREFLENKGIIDKLATQIGGLKPSIMIMPSDSYCIEKGYVLNNGQPDYLSLLSSDRNMRDVIVKIQELMNERGYTPKDFESEARSIQRKNIEDSFLTDNLGNSIKESMYDKITKRSKADIVVKVEFKLNKFGLKRNVSFQLQGIDSYTNKSIASRKGEGKPSFTTSYSILFEEAVLQHMDNFNSQIQNHFDEMANEGREISLLVLCILDDSNGEVDYFSLEMDIGDSTINEMIEDWVADKAKNGKYAITDATENKIHISQLRIPLFFERKGKKRSLSARKFAVNLGKYLLEELKDIPRYSISKKIVTKGLGEAYVILKVKLSDHIQTTNTKRPAQNNDIEILFDQRQKKISKDDKLNKDQKEFKKVFDEENQNK